MSSNPIQAPAEWGLGLDGAAETFAEGGIGGIEGGEVEVRGGWVGLFVYRDGSSFFGARAQQNGSESYVSWLDERLERVGNRTDGHEGSCIFVGFVHYQPCLGPTSGRQAARKPCVVRCCYWKGLAEVRFPGWQVVNCLISTTVANDIPFGSVVYQYLCKHIY